MISKIRNIINKLKKTKERLDEAKEDFGSFQEKSGRSSEEIGLTVNLLEDLEKQNKIPFVIEKSGQFFSQALDEETSKLLTIIHKSDIEDILHRVEGITDTASTITLSGTVVVIPGDRLPSSHSKLIEFVKQKDSQEEIFERLNSLDPSLATEYKKVWNSFFASSEDKTRAAMALMREVINRLYYHFAPTEEVRSFAKLQADEIVKKNHRINYIASQIITDERKKDIFLNAENAFTEICNKLSAFKKHGELDEKKTESFLYEADSLIKLLLDSIPETSSSVHTIKEV